MSKEAKISDLEICKNELTKLGAFNVHKNETIELLASMLDSNTPQHMAESISIYSLGAFINAFNCKIRLECNDKFPMSLVFLILAKSGSNKTSSVEKTKNAFSIGYDALTRSREIKIARSHFDATAETLENVETSPIEVKLGTPAGFIYAMNCFQAEQLGAPAIVVDEFATELRKNENFEENLGIIAEVYDKGNLPSRMMKSIEAQSKPVKGMAITVMLIGAEYSLINDKELLDKLEMEMQSKYSRRSFFIFPNFTPELNTSINAKDFLQKQYEQEDLFDNVLREVGGLSSRIADRFINSPKDENMIDIAQDAKDLYFYYKGYCTEKALLINDIKIGLEQKDRHWRVIKLAGIFAIANEHDVIAMQDLLEAISFAESIAGYMENFSERATELSHEKLVNICVETNEVPSPHVMMKLGLVKNEKDISGLVQLANSKLQDKKLGRIALDEKGKKLEYKRFTTSDKIGISGMVSIGSKNQRARNMSSGFTYRQIDFEQVIHVLAKDVAYCAFEFIDGKRSKENVIGTTNLIILDVDDSDFTDVEISDALEDYKHVICRTSDGANPYKFRIALQADVLIETTSREWTQLMKLIEDHLKIKIDILPQSQTFFGYAGRVPLTNFDGELYPVSELIRNIDAPEIKRKQLTIEDDKKTWESRYELFKMWYNLPHDAHDQKHRSLYACAARGCNAGASVEVMMRIVSEINDDRDEKVRDGYLESLEKSLISEKEGKQNDEK